MRPLHALLILAALAPGCTQRSRSNPFDPANPTTHGRPVDFVALAGDGQATLRWTTVSAPGLLGYQLYRSLYPDSAFVGLGGVLPPDQDQVVDTGLLDGTAHFYRIHYVFDRGLGPLFSSDVATPGPVTPWVTDAGLPALDRVTADGRHVAQRIDGAVTYSAGDVDVDISSGAVWTCDPFLGGVTIYDPTGGTLRSVAGGVSDPVAVAVNPADHTAWIGDDASSELLHFAADGSAATPPVLSPFEGPIGIALDPVDRSLWVCERRGSRVRLADAGGTPIATAYVINPSRVAVDSVTREAWVTSFSHGTIVRLSPAAVREDSVTSIVNPGSVVVDARRGRVWVTDPVAGQVVALSRAGVTQFVVRGIAGASDIALDPTTGEAWVTAPDAGAVVRISPAGAVLRVLGGLSEPIGIALDLGPGFGPRPALSTRATGALGGSAVPMRAGAGTASRAAARAGPGTAGPGASRWIRN